MELNFAGNFYTTKEKILEPRTTGGGGSLGEYNPPGLPPSWRAQVGCAHLVAPQTLNLTP